MSSGDSDVSPLAERLTELREAAGLTQVQLASRLGTTQSTVGGWETGRHPQPMSLVALADLYGVDMRWLVTGEGLRARDAPPDAAVRLEVIRMACDPEATIPVDALRVLRSMQTPPESAEQVEARQRRVTEAAQAGPGPKRRTGRRAGGTGDGGTS